MYSLSLSMVTLVLQCISLKKANFCLLLFFPPLKFSSPSYQLSCRSSVLLPKFILQPSGTTFFQITVAEMQLLNASFTLLFTFVMHLTFALGQFLRTFFIWFTQRKFHFFFHNSDNNKIIQQRNITINLVSIFKLSSAFAEVLVQNQTNKNAFATLLVYEICRKVLLP